MNILFIGPYRQTDGWGVAAKAYIKSLLKTKHNVAIKPIYMSRQIDRNIPEEILEVEQNQLPHYDVVIQNVLPQLLECRNDQYKTAGLCLFETDNLQYTPWIRAINNIDELLVLSKQEVNIAQNSGVKVPIQQVPIGIDTVKFNQQYHNPKWANTQWKDSFVFYFIGEYTSRKNINALLTAFHREFKYDEPVELIVKTGRSGISSSKLLHNINQDFLKLKETLQLHNNIDQYKQEWVISERLSEEHLYALHQIADCFVMPSHGEACCLPLLDAIGFGKQTIITDNTGMTSYTNSDISHIIPSYETPINTHERPLPYLYTARETWQEIDIIALQKAMRKAYNMEMFEKLKFKTKCQQWIENFSHANTAKKLEEIL